MQTVRFAMGESELERNFIDQLGAPLLSQLGAEVQLLNVQ